MDPDATSNTQSHKIEKRNTINGIEIKAEMTKDTEMKLDTKKGDK